MDETIRTSTEVTVQEGPELFGARFYTFPVEFTVVNFPDPEFNADGNGAVGTMHKLADALADDGWTVQAHEVRAAANELDRQILGTE